VNDRVSAYMKVGKKQKTRTDFEKAFRIKPGFEAAKKDAASCVALGRWGRVQLPASGTQRRPMLDEKTKRTLSDYLNDQRRLPNESAKTHRFASLIPSLFPGTSATCISQISPSVPIFRGAATQLAPD